MTKLRATIAASLRASARHDSNGQVAPAAILWADPERVWEHVIPQLQEAAPICCLGPWKPEALQGPAIWIRALLAGGTDVPAGYASPDAKTPWIVYMPGWSRADLRGVESAPKELQPLAELQYRAQWWQQQNGHPWTPLSFLGSPAGAGLAMAKDAATSTVLVDGLSELLTQNIEDLNALGRIDAGRIQQLLMPDDVAGVLRWIDDPESAKESMDPSRWKAFCGLTSSQYSIDPRKDTPLTGAALLGRRSGNWSNVWARFVDNPTKYPNIPAVLNQAKPDTGALFEIHEHPDSWPSSNAEAENDLRKILNSTESMTAAEASARLLLLDKEHGPRRDWVWSVLGMSPLARALKHLADIVQRLKSSPGVGTVEEQALAYLTSAWRIDDEALRALAAVTTLADRQAVGTALGAIYEPWLDSTATAFQYACTTGGYGAKTGLDIANGTCVVFVDGLRMDIGHRLRAILASNNLIADIDYRLAGFPTVTPTGKPAVAPFNVPLGPGPGFAAGSENGSGMEGAVFSKALDSSGVEKLTSAAFGNSSGKAWTEIGDLDSSGHTHGHKLVDRIDGELSLVVDRVLSLLEAGWSRVVIVTDHGWLLAPRTLRKVTPVPMHLTEGEKCRKDRVARLSGSTTNVSYPTVPWTWDSSVFMTTAPGAASFEAGVVYTHGGLSLQESVTPVITIGRGAPSPLEAKIEGFKWQGMRCRVDIAHPSEGLLVELRGAPGDSASCVAGPKPVTDGEAKVLVKDDDWLEKSVYIVLLDNSGKIVHQVKTAVGGNA